jgi:hypothetical protein
MNFYKFYISYNKNETKIKKNFVIQKNVTVIVVQEVVREDVQVELQEVVREDVQVELVHL